VRALPLRLPPALLRLRRALLRLPPVAVVLGVAVPPVAVLVVTASVVVRLLLLDRQSYWADELFSVTSAAAPPAGWWAGAATEVHPPLYAALLSAWIHVGGTRDGWTRLFSVACALAAVAVTRRGLRGRSTSVPLDRSVRWALTATTAAGGPWLVYSLEARSYALLLLASAGLTAATLRQALAPSLARREWSGPVSLGDARRRDRLAWLGWATLAATTHLFGAFLALAAGAVLAVRSLAGRRSRRRIAGHRDSWRWLLLAAVACLPQAAWLAAGRARPGFAAGTQWIAAPRPHDLRDLLTSAFASGSLVPHKDGFAWTSRAGVTVAGAVVVGAALAGAWRRTRRTGGPPTDGSDAPGSLDGTGTDRTGAAAAVLLSLAAVVIAGAFALSQGRHVWTLRNLVVVQPALVWGTVCLAAAATGSRTGRRTVAAVAVCLTGLALVPLGHALDRPYKTDVRGLVDYLADQRAQDPAVTVAIASDWGAGSWVTASDRRDPVTGQVPARVRAALDGAVQVPLADRALVTRAPGPQVVVLYHGVSDPRPAGLVRETVARLGRGCVAVPLYGFGVVRCAPPAGPAAELNVLRK